MKFNALRKWRRRMFPGILRVHRVSVQGDTVTCEYRNGQPEAFDIGDMTKVLAVLTPDTPTRWEVVRLFIATKRDAHNVDCRLTHGFQDLEARLRSVPGFWQDGLEAAVKLLGFGPVTIPLWEARRI